MILQNLMMILLEVHETKSANDCQWDFALNKRKYHTFRCVVFSDDLKAENKRHDE